MIEKTDLIKAILKLSFKQYRRMFNNLKQYYYFIYLGASGVMDYSDKSLTDTFERKFLNFLKPEPLHINLNVC